MNPTQLDALNARALPLAELVAVELLGGGNVRLSGNEVDMIATHRGDRGFGSFKLNVGDGLWSDFASQADFKSGKGVLQLVCYIRGCGMAEAARWLTDFMDGKAAAPFDRPAPAPKPDLQLVAVEAETAQAQRPDMHPEHGFPAAVYDYFDVEGRLAFAVYRFEDGQGGKETIPCTFSEAKQAWVWKLPPAPLPLFMAGDRKSDAVLIVEGEKAALAAAAKFPDWRVITSQGGTNAIGKSDWAAHLEGAAMVLVSPDHDDPGKKYGHTVAVLARAFGVQEVGVIDPAALGWEKADDLADHPEQSLDELEAATVMLDDLAGSKLEHAVIAASSILGVAGYDRAKDALAALVGVSKRALDALTKEARTKAAPDDASGLEDEDDGTGPRGTVPFEGQVDAREIFDSVRAILSAHVYLDDPATDAVSLWLMLSWVQHRIATSPLLMLTSPAKRCGKSTVLEVAATLVNRPMLGANLTAATIFRAVDLWSPTLLMDEADTFLAANPELGGILNSGWRKSQARVYRISGEGEDMRPTAFSTWCAKVIAGIGTHAADTLIDRSIVIRLQRKPLEVTRLRVYPDALEEGNAALRSKLARWALDCRLPDVVDERRIPLGSERAQQNWGELLRVAATIGPDIEARCIAAAAALGDGSDLATDRQSDLLADLLPLIEQHRGRDVIPTAVVTAHLNSLADGQWISMSRGKGLTGHTLGRMLKPFQIAPVQVKLNGKAVRGYAPSDFELAFKMYLGKSLEVAG